MEPYPALNIRIKHAKGVRTWGPPKIDVILIYPVLTAQHFPFTTFPNRQFLAQTIRF